MTDVALFHTDDGGDISIDNGRVLLDSTPRTAVYLSLFGGNEEDGATDATASKQWWGNLSELDSEQHARSATQHLLRALPVVTSNLPRIADAVKRDLSWMEAHLGAAPEVGVSIPARNRIAIDVEIEVDGETYSEHFEERWGPE